MNPILLSMEEVLSLKIGIFVDRYKRKTGHSVTLKELLQWHKTRAKKDDNHIFTKAEKAKFPFVTFESAASDSSQGVQEDPNGIVFVDIDTFKELPDPLEKAEKTKQARELLRQQYGYFCDWLSSSGGIHAIFIIDPSIACKEAVVLRLSQLNELLKEKLEAELDLSFKCLKQGTYFPPRVIHFTERTILEVPTYTDEELDALKPKPIIHPERPVIANSNNIDASAYDRALSKWVAVVAPLVSCPEGRSHNEQFMRSVRDLAAFVKGEPSLSYDAIDAAKEALIDAAFYSSGTFGDYTDSHSRRRYIEQTFERHYKSGLSFKSPKYLKISEPVQAESVDLYQYLPPLTEEELKDYL